MSLTQGDQWRQLGALGGGGRRLLAGERLGGVAKQAAETVGHITYRSRATSTTTPTTMSMIATVEIPPPPSSSLSPDESGSGSGAGPRRVGLGCRLGRRVGRAVVVDVPAAAAASRHRTASRQRSPRPPRRRT